MKRLLRVLVFLRLVNGDDNVSLTNIALMVGIVGFYRHPGTVEIGGLLAAIAMYQHKKILAAAQEPEGQVTNDPSPRFDAIEKRIGDVAAEVASIRSGQTWSAALGKR